MTAVLDAEYQFLATCAWAGSAMSAASARDALWLSCWSYTAVRVKEAAD
jgi:hypothetical protein